MLKKTPKKLITIILTLAVVLGLIFAMSLAASAAAKPNMLLYSGSPYPADGYSYVKGASLSDTSSVITYYTTTGCTPEGVAADPLTDYVYYSDFDGKLYRNNLTGTSQTALVTGYYIDDIALDTGNGMIYFSGIRVSDNKLGVFSVSISGGTPTPIYIDSTGDTTPEGITIDPLSGILYFADCSSSNGNIYKYNISTAVTSTVLSGYMPNALAVDTVNKTLYFSGNKADNSSWGVYSVSASGGTPATVYNHTAATGTSEGVAFDSSSGILYFADYIQNGDYTIDGDIYKYVGGSGSSIITDYAATKLALLIYPPTLSATSASSVTSSGATLNFTSDKAGTYYYLVYAAADAAPSAATVKAQGTAVAKGSGTAAASSNSVSVSGLSASTSYKAYVVVRDNNGNLSDVYTVNITTSAAANTAPSFTAGATNTLTVNENASATSIVSLLHVSDSDSGQTLTWSQATGGEPSHGSLSFSSATASSGSTDITPGGTITYTPTADYTGSDSFMVQVSDGTDTDTITVNVTVNAASTAVGGWINISDEIDGLNYDATKSAYYPSLVEFDGSWYAAWEEDGNIRVAKRSSSDGAWSFVDGGTSTGINYNSAKAASYPDLAVYNGNLYAVWVEELNYASGGVSIQRQVRAAKYNGGSSWTFVDGIDANGVTDFFTSDYTSTNYHYASNVSVAADATGLYVAWVERYSSSVGTMELHVAKYNGTSWSIIGGTTATSGLNYNTSLTADYPSLVTDGSGNLYLAWQENGKVHAKYYNGSSWSHLSGVGLNYDANEYVNNPPQITLFGGIPYVAWDEQNSSDVSQIRLKKYLGGSWVSVDGGASTGLNYNTAKGGYGVALASDSDNLYLGWIESSDICSQYRIVSYNTTDGFTDMDADGISSGGDATGINMDNLHGIGFNEVLCVGASELATVFCEYDLVNYIYQIQFKAYDPTFELASDADQIASITPTNGTLYPAVATDVYDYTILVGKDTTSETFILTLEDADATFIYNGTSYDSGSSITVNSLVAGDNILSMYLVTQEASIVKYLNIRINRAVSDTQIKISPIADSYYDNYGAYPFGYADSGNATNYVGTYDSSYGMATSVLKFDYGFITEDITAGQLNIYVNYKGDSRAAEDPYLSLYGSTDTTWTRYTAAAPSKNTTIVTADSTGIAAGSWKSVNVFSYLDGLSGTTATFVMEGNGVDGDTECDFSFYSEENSTDKPYLLLTYGSPATKLSTPTNLAWDGTTPGKAKWDTVSNASSYSVQLKKGGSDQGFAQSVASGTTYYDFTSAITAAGNGTYTFTVTAIGNGTTYTNSDAATSGNYVYVANNAPVASAVAVSGTARAGETLTGSYTYTDADSDGENGSTYKWYRATDNSGTGAAAIDGATSLTYTLTSADEGKYICFEVKPYDGKDYGTAVKSSYTESVAVGNITVTLSSASKNVSSLASANIDSGITVSCASNITGGTVNINGFADGDTLTFTNGGGVSGSYSSSKGILTITGTASAAAYQTFLRSVVFSTTAGSGSRAFEIILSNTSSNVMYFSGTGHFYQYVGTGATWSNAKTAAESMSYAGVDGNGYLATITSAEENSFITQKLGADAWIGASDEASEGTWKWMGGPEAGQTLVYTNWNGGEPNNSGGNEDYGEIYCSGANPGTWNDKNVDSVLGYVVEYGSTEYTLTGNGAASLAVTLLKTDPIINSWPTVSAITYGQTFGDAISGGSASVGGSFSIADASTAPDVSGSPYTKTITFTPTDTANYNSLTHDVSVTVNKADPTITAWPTVSAITYGQTFANAISGGSASVTGSFGIADAATAPAVSGSPYDKTVTFTPTDTGNYNTLTHDVSVTVNKANPTITAWPTVSAITYGDTFADAISGGLASVAGSFSIADAATVPIVSGSPYTKTITFTPADTANYNSLTHDVSVTVNKADQAALSITDKPAVPAYDDTFTLSTSGGSGTGSVTWGATGGATVSAAGLVTVNGMAEVTITATKAADSNYNQATATYTFTPAKADPTVTWPTVSAITYGQTFGNAISGGLAGVAGSFGIADAATAPTVSGSPYTKTITFTPTDTTHYNSLTHDVSVTVNKADPTVTWPTVSAITYGQTFGNAISGGSAGVAGSFGIADAATAPTVSGSPYTKTITFTPADTTNYNSLTHDVSVTVNKADPSITAWPTVSAIAYGDTFAEAISGGSASVAGSFSIADAATAPAVSGSPYTKTITFTPTDTANYNSLTHDVSVTVNKADPTITAWPTVSAITYGDTFAEAISGGLASVAGSFSIADAATVPIVSGSPYTKTITFTPADTANYNSLTHDVSVTVNKADQAALSITDKPAAPAYGDIFTLSSSGGSGTGSVSWSATGGAMVDANSGEVTVNGMAEVTISATKAGDSNYNEASDTYTFTPAKANPSVTWPTVSTIIHGQTFADAISGGSASVAGSFTIEDAALVPAVSTTPYDKTITFTPDDTAKYNVLTHAVQVTVRSKSNNTTTTNTTDTVVEVNGEKQDAGTSSTTTNNGQTVTTVTVDDKKLEVILEQKGNNATVTIPISNGTDVAVGVLTGQMVKNMETKEATLEIKTGNVTYTLPASQINIDTVSEQIGQQVELKDIQVSITVSSPPDDTVRVVQDTANENNYQIVVQPVQFEITCTSGDKTVSVSKFNGYVERTVAIPEGVDPSKITTGVVLNADGTFTHVPTTIIVIDGKYYAKINSLTNSTYTVIYNPVEFADVANHWAKDAINDMGSRLVVTGIGNNNYDPASDITRAEFAAIMVRALGLTSGSGASGFSDVDISKWYSGYIKTASEYGIITGYSDGRFGPNNKITREQAMTMIARAMKLTGLEPTLTDGQISQLLAVYGDGVNASAYAKGSIAACLKTGVVTGKSSSLLAPKDYITRAEVAVIVQRLLHKSELI